MLLSILIVTAFALLPTLALAQNADGSQYNHDPALGQAPSLHLDPGMGLGGSVSTIESWVTNLQGVGLRLFVYLAIIEFAWVMLVTIIQGRSRFSTGSWWRTGFR